MQIKSTSDVWYSAFLLIKGYKIHNYTIIGRGKVNCQFEMTNDDWQRLKLEFHNSEISQYKSTIEKIKDLGF